MSWSRPGRLAQCLAALALVAALRAPTSAESLSVVVSGKYHDPVPAYLAGRTLFLSAGEAGALYGAQVYWYQVAGRIQMSLRGRSLTFFAGSNEVKEGAKTTFKLESPVLLRGSQAWIPLSFFQSADFVAWAGWQTAFDPSVRLLSLDRKSSLGALRWFSYKDFTRISIEADPRLTYHGAARGLTGVELSIPKGSVEATEEGQIEDGVVKAYYLVQGSHGAKLAIRLTEPGLVWRARSLEKPHRIVLDVMRQGVSLEQAAEPPAEPAAPAANAILDGRGDGSLPLAVPVITTTAAVVAVSTPAAGAQQAHRRRRIVIDAGHGGRDPGATGRNGTQEKDINLAAALELARLLRQDGAFEVLLTRQDDSFVPLAERSRIANDSEADLFISLHCNASLTARDEGYEVYFLSEKASDPQAQALADFENSSLELEGKPSDDAAAQLLLGELSKTEYLNSGSELAALVARDEAKRVDIDDRGVKQAGFYVLRGTHAPAVLIEMAYLTNPRDEARLGSKRFRRALVDGVYAGILDYAKRQGWTAEVAGR